MEPGKRILLPNARVGVEYSAPLTEHVGGAVEVTVEGLDGTGLKFDAQALIIAGIPVAAGDVSLTLQSRHPDQIDASRFVSRVMQLTVIADPRSLWKNLEPDPAAPYPRPNSDSRLVEGNQGKRLVAASQRGRSHAHEAKFRDDDFCLDVVPASGWHLLAVADGAGSALYSRRGSQIACEAAVRIVREGLAGTGGNALEKVLVAYRQDPGEKTSQSVADTLYNVMTKGVYEAYRLIHEEAIGKGVPIKNFATTLLVAAAKKYDFGWFVGAYWVGDGGIGLYREGRDVCLLGEPDGGEFAGQTRFLTMKEIIEQPEIRRRVRFSIVDDFTALVLMTDGVTDPKFDNDSNLQQRERWDDLWKDIALAVDLKAADADIQLLKWLDFWSQGNHDDRTIAILS